MEILKQFCLDTENPENNYELAEWYMSKNHISPAHTYYLRAAERSEDQNLSYKCLLKSAEIYNISKNRGFTQKSILENALILNPKRPEAYYYLCLYYEAKKEWTNCYKYACIALDLCDFNQDSLGKEFQKNWVSLLIFMKAMSSWWCGKGLESRKLFRKLAFEHWDKIDKTHKDLVKKNMDFLGAVPPNFPVRKYNKNDFNLLRYKFKNAELISENYSQVFQDIFVLSILDGKRNGSFVEIGGADPIQNNNTLLLEKEFNWSGVSIDFNKDLSKKYNETRPNIDNICANALYLDYNEIFNSKFENNIIDYLQLDIDPSENTYKCLLKIPFNKYKFRVITYEHDHYNDISQSYRKKSREFLLKKGYKLLVNDISLDGDASFEDWWIHPELIDENIINVMESITENPQKITDYIFINNIE